MDCKYLAFGLFGGLNDGLLGLWCAGIDDNAPWIGNEKRGMTDGCMGIWTGAGCIILVLINHLFALHIISNCKKSEHWDFTCRCLTFFFLSIFSNLL